jgi:hypothetical protein
MAGMDIRNGENPGRHDANELISATMQLRRQISCAEAAAAEAGAVASTVPEAWRGTDALACAAQLGRLRQHLDKVRAALQGQVAGVERYRVDLDRIARSYQPLRARLEVAHAWIDHNPPPTGPHYGLEHFQQHPAPAEVQAMRTWAPVHAAQQEEIEACRRAIERLREERLLADQAVVSVLAANRVSDWRSARRLLLEAGLTDPRTAAAAEVARVMAAASRAVLQQERPSQRSLEELQDLFDAYGYSPEHMHLLFSTLGGAETLELLDRVSQGATGGGAADPLLSLPAAIRAGYASASVHWRGDKAQAMAEQLVPLGLKDAAASASPVALGYLLAGPVLGHGLVAALARRFDQRERLASGALACGPWISSDPVNRLQELARAHSADGQQRRLSDPAGLALSQLARYPAEAHRFLTEPEGTERVKYWFGRDWSGVDGYQGAMELWAAASGHPVGFSTPEWRLLAEQSGNIINTLDANSHFSGETLAPAASAPFTLSLMLHLPGMVESSLVQDIETAGVPGPALDVRMPDGSVRHVPAVDEEVLARVLSVVYESGGAGAMRTFGAEYSVLLAQAAGATDNPVDKADVGLRLVQLHALLGGVEDGVLINEGAQRDEQARQWIGPVETVAGMLPIEKLLPGFSDLPRAVRDQLTGFREDTAGSSGSLLEALWAQNAARAEHEADGREELRSLGLKATVMATLAESLGHPVGPLPPVEASPADASAADASASDASVADDYREWIARHEPGLDAELSERYSEMTEAAGMKATAAPPTVSRSMAGYEASYEHFRAAVTDPRTSPP